MSWPVTTEPRKLPAIIGSVSRPASVGVAPRATWKYWPMNDDDAYIETPTAAEAMMLSAVVRSATILSGMIGCATFDSTMMSRMIPTSEPPTIAPDCHDHQS